MQTQTQQSEAVYILNQSPCGMRYGIQRIDPGKYGPVTVEPPTMLYQEAVKVYAQLVEKLRSGRTRNQTGEYSREAAAKRQQAHRDRITALFTTVQAQHPGVYVIRVRNNHKDHRTYCVLAGGWADEMACALGIEKKDPKGRWIGVETYDIPEDRFGELVVWAALKGKSVGIATKDRVNLLPLPPAASPVTADAA